MKESTEMKQGLKGSQDKSNNSGRGGARAGAGRKKTKGETQQLHIDMPLSIIEAMEATKITNKTSFMVYIAAKTLVTYQDVRRNAKLRSVLQKIIKDPNIHF